MKVIKTLTLASAILSTLATPALATDPISYGSDIDSLKTLQISKPGDLELSCQQLSVEAENMAQVIHTTQDVKNNSDMKSTGVTAAGAIGSFLIGSATGGIGLAVGGFLMNQGIEDRKDRADEMQDIAEQRRTLMMGIFNAKECFGPIEHAMRNPEEFDPLRKIALNTTESKYQADLRRRYND